MRRFRECLKKATTELDKEQCEILFQKLTSDFENLPQEIFENLLLTMDIKNIKQLCAASSTIREKCDSIDIWIRLIKRDAKTELTRQEFVKLMKLSPKFGDTRDYFKVYTLEKVKNSTKPENYANYAHIESFLIKIVRENNLDILKFLFKHDQDIRGVMIHNPVYLNDASFKGYLDMVKFLVENGAKVHSMDKNYATALIAASSGGHLDIVKYLVSKGATIDDMTYYGDSPISLASRKGYYDIVKFLVSRNAFLGEMTAKHRQVTSSKSPLLLAIENNHNKIAKYLIKNGANVHEKSEVDWKKMDAFEVAKKFDNKEMVEYLEKTKK